MKLRRVFGVLCVLFLVLTGGNSFADSRPQAEFIYQWNDVLSIALRELNTFHEDPAVRSITGDNPPRSARAMAIVHLAIFEAVNGITGTHRRFTPLRRESTGPISIEAAIREAATVTLMGLFGADGTELTRRKGLRFAGRDDILRHAPVESLIEMTWRSQETYLNDNFSRPEVDAGKAWGAEVANYILNRRHEDGSHIDPGYEYILDDNGKPVEGAYITDKYTPEADNPPSEPGWGQVLPFAVSDIASFTNQISGPVAIDRHPGSDWMRHLDEVRILGERKRYNPDNYDGGVLPADVRHQLQTAFFWSQKGLTAEGGKSGGFPTVTPVGQWGHAATLTARDKDLSIDDAARLFALLSVAGADAMIAAWKVKYDHNFWRPVHAIRRGERPIDADWIPLIPTSEHPEYVSGHAASSGAAATILALFFGSDSMQISFFGDDSLDGDDWRTFDSFRAAAEEAGRSRIYGGIHYRFSTEDGLLLGRLIAEQVFADHFSAAP